MTQTINQIMYYFNCIKSLTRTVGTLSLFSLSIVLTANPANAFSLDYGADFETDGLSDWNATGDTSIQPTLTGTYGGDSRSYNAGIGNQLVLTTSCSNIAYTSTSSGYDNTECFDTQDDTQPRNDDSTATVGTFNYSGNDQADANAENSGTTVPGAIEITNLQEFLGLSPNALDISAQDGSTDIGGNRTAKEGSASLLNEPIIASNDFRISFDWNYLTNDGQDALGDSDYGFVVIYDNASSISSREPIVLADSDSLTLPNLTETDNAYALSTSGSYTSEVLAAGDYSVGFGVVDTNGVSRSSALLVDNFLAQEVPFEFSPTAGIGFVAIFLGFGRLRRGIKQNKSSEES